jgi:hypothetical protein
MLKAELVGWNAVLLLVASSAAISCGRSEQSEARRSSTAEPSAKPVALEQAGAGSVKPQAGASSVEPQTDAGSVEAQVIFPSTTVLEDDRNAKGVKMAKPLFQCGHANFAWGRQAYGYVLDDGGRIWFYDLGQTWSPEPTADGLFLESALRARFKNPVAQSLRVPKARLEAMRKKAERARSSRIERKQAMLDAGGAGCEAYLWDKTDAYRLVELGNVGDTLITNASPEAAELNAWLQGELGMLGRPKTLRK